MKSKNSKFAFIFAIIAIVLLLATCVGTCVSPDSNKAGVDSIHIQVAAKTQAEEYVKSLLKSPESAVFQDEYQNIWMMPDSTVVIKGIVDADNSFGVKTRNNYYVKVKWYINENNSEVFEVIDVKLE